MGMIYLDNNASTPLDPRVRSLVVWHLENTFGNASSSDHAYGDEARRTIDRARNEIAQLAGAKRSQVVFTSGATEAINLVLQGYVARSKHRPVRVGVMPLEHKAVIETVDALVHRELVSVRPLEITPDGQLNIDDLESALRSGLDLVICMHANNEIGVVYPLSEVLDLCGKYGSRLVCDASQSLGKVPFSFEHEAFFFAAFSAHKMYGPKGVGALVLKDPDSIEPLLFGGGQERKLRPGTENVPIIAGFGEACRILHSEMLTDSESVKEKRDWLINELSSIIPEMRVNGGLDRRLSGNLNVSFRGTPSSAIIARIRDRIAVSRGSACSSGVESPSHVLRAIKVPDEYIDGTLRIGIGKFNTWEEIREAAQIISEAVLSVRKLVT